MFLKFQIRPLIFDFFMSERERKKSEICGFDPLKSIKMNTDCSIEFKIAVLFVFKACRLAGINVLALGPR